MSGVLTEVSSNCCFGGIQKVFSHKSHETQTKMTFAVYLPPQAETEKVPVLYWLSGLTCTEQNFITKAGAQRYAAEHGLIIVCPDTSPRGLNIDGEHDSYDFGSGAGFYVDATEDKWKTNYRMYSYVTKELPALVEKEFNAIPEKKSISGHSMGGHGALVLALKNPGMYTSVSAFSPICNPTQCDWGRKAFKGYFGEDTETWKSYDAAELVKKYNGPPLLILADQGTADEFLTKGQLLPDHLVSACASNQVAIQLRMQDGYDHSYYFISSFIGDHIRHHAEALTS